MNRKHYIAISLILVLLIVCVFAWKQASRNEIRNVVLISIDTCRADHLSCYGFGRKTTPNIDAIAKEGVLFENVISPVPITLPSHSSMLTGTIPAYHGVRDNSLYKLGDSNTTLAEILKDNGFNTAAFISAFVMNSKYGIDQGFDVYDDSFDESTGIGEMNERRAKETTAHAVSWLQRKEQKPFFLFVHYFDPHESYDPPEPFRTAYADDLYAGEISYTDHYIGKVIDELKRLDIYDSTAVIITSDHGESRGEHGAHSHGYLIYQSTLRVPLIVKAPNAAKGLRIGDRVGLVDVVPTVCSMLDIEFSNDQGADLSGYLFDNEAMSNGRRYYCESLLPTMYGCNPLLGVVTDRWKYIETTRPELYDLLADPDEKNDLSKSHGQRCKILQDGLKQITSLYSQKDQGDNQIELDIKSQKQLASLGYVSSGELDESFEFDQSKPDAKDFVEFHQLASQANYLTTNGHYDEAEIVCEKMKKIMPDFADTYRYLGDIALKRRDHQKAIDNYNKYLSIAPDDPRVINDLGLAYLRNKDVFKAREYFEKAIGIDRDDAKAYYNLGNISLIEKNPEKAIECYLRSLEIEPDYLLAHKKLGQVFLMAGRFEDAIVHCHRYLEIETKSAEVRILLAHSLKALNRSQEAVYEYYKVLESTPDNIEALNSIAWLCSTSNEVKARTASDALDFAKRICEITKYKNASALDTLAAVYADGGDYEQAVTTVRKAIELLESSGDDAGGNQLKERMELYRKHQPLRMQ